MCHLGTQNRLNPYKTLVKRDILGRKEPGSGPGDKLPNSALPNIEQARQNQPEM